MTAGPEIPQHMQKKTHGRSSEAEHDEDEEINKKVKAEEAALLPEELFLGMNPGQVLIHVRINGDDRGRKLELKLDPSARVSSIRDQAAAFFGVDKSQFRLKAPDVTSLKDDNSLAYYNFLNGTVIEVTPKK